jgi:restriction endonuclease Mrr
VNAGQDREPNLSSLLRAGLQLAVDALTKSAPTGAGGDSDLVFRLQALSPTEFESWVAARLVETGYLVVRTGGPGDEGIDILARKQRDLVVVQCKRFRTAVVGPHVVRELLGSITATTASRGILVTTGIATNAAVQYARRQHPPIELWDGPYLAQRWPRAIPKGPSSVQPRPSMPERMPTANRPIARPLRVRGQRPPRQRPQPLI